jgi:hypothetical protein
MVALTKLCLNALRSRLAGRPPPGIPGLKMSRLRLIREFASLAFCVFLAACGSSGTKSGDSGQTTPATPSVTVTPASASITTAQALVVTIAVSAAAGRPAPTGSVMLSSGSYASAPAPLSNGSASLTIAAGQLAAGTATLTAKYTPDAAGSVNYYAATGSTIVTVTAPSLISPTVIVSPSASSVTTSQPLPVTVTVGGGSGSPTPSGSVIVSSGGYASTPIVLNNGTASIVIPAGSLALGSIQLTAQYQPDSASSATYSAATGTAGVTVTTPQTYVLTVNSAAPSSGIGMTLTPPDNHGAGNGTTPFTRTYNAGTTVMVSAPIDTDSYAFVGWSGCAAVPAPGVCTLNMNANTTVTATYNQNTITSITVSPNVATIGVQQQFTATVNGVGPFSHSVTWSLSCPLCGALSAGTLTSGGLYTAPYPAPASVTITATSVQDPTESGSAAVALNPPATSAGPALTVDAGNRTHAISPLIYGMNAYSMNPSVARTVNLAANRWGGNNTSRYNYVLDVSSSASDWYFENYSQATGQQDTSGFNALVEKDAAVGAKTMGTVPVLGWVAKNGTACSFLTSAYPNQVATDPYKPSCGDGLYPQGMNGCTNSSGCNITGNDPAQTSQPVGPSWAGSWVSYLASKFGTAANGGVAIYDLDNEPAWWNSVHRDVHPLPSTYDEVTLNGIATAKAIKNADPTAAVSGPVVDYWWNYFYSKKDIENGWRSGPCYEPWSGPTDRQAHGGVPFIEYYLQQFNSASAAYGARLLDYLDLHTYFAGSYNGTGVGLTTAGDTEEQKVRLNSTRVFWDPAYTDPNEQQPNYITDANYTSSCNLPLQAPQLIPMAQKWVADDYPGTKIAFTEYNWGGQENINGAVAQADILGIFGKYGIDLATLWGPPDPSTQLPGLIAFEMYRNYDGHNSMFGDTALASSSADQGKLAVYGAVRSSDSAITIMVVNKTYGALQSAISLENYAGTATTAQVFQYSAANLNQIMSQPALPIAAPPGGGAGGSISGTFPGQSITLLVVAN